MVTMPGIKLVARVLLVVGGLAYIQPRILGSAVLELGLGPITIRLLIGLLSAFLGLYFIIKKVP